MYLKKYNLEHCVYHRLGGNKISIILSKDYFFLLFFSGDNQMRVFAMNGNSPADWNSGFKTYPKTNFVN